MTTTSPFLTPLVALVGTCDECERRFTSGQQVWFSPTTDRVVCEDCTDVCEVCHRTTETDDMMYDYEDCSVCDPCLAERFARIKATHSHIEWTEAGTLV